MELEKLLLKICKPKSFQCEIKGDVHQNRESLNGL